MRPDIDADIEAVLVRADRYALTLMAPTARSTVLMLRLLRGGPQTLSDLRSACAALQLTCKGMARAAEFLEKMGLIEFKDGYYELTSYGREVADAVYEIVEDMRMFAYKLLRGEADELEVYAHLVTTFASTIGVAESYLEDSRSLRLALTIHAYVTLLSAALTALLAERSDSLVEALRRIGSP